MICRCHPSNMCGRCAPDECAYCHVALLDSNQQGAHPRVVWKDLAGKWQESRYCLPCARELGELEDERVQRAIRTAEEAGV